MTAPRVALVSDWYLPRFGGIELHLRDLTVHLKAEGVDLEVLTPVPGPGEVEGVVVRRLCAAGRADGGYRFPPPPHANSARDLFFFLECFASPHRKSAHARLREQLRAGRYDLVHVHFGNAPLAYAATREAVRLGLPVLTTFHSMIGHVQIPLAAALGRMLGCARWPVRHSAVSSVVARSLRPLLGAAPVEILPNGIDADWWGAARAMRAGNDAGGAGAGGEGAIELLAVMRLHPRKRPQALLRAVAQARRELPQGQRLRLRIIGEGPLRAALERQAGRLGLGPDAEFLGRLGREEIRAALSRADLFLLPSRLESFGIAALEARCAGVPVLGMREAGLRDFLTEGADCLLADGDRAFAAALARYGREPDLRHRLAEGCRAAVPGLSWPEVTARHVLTYRQLLAK